MPVTVVKSCEFGGCTHNSGLQCTKGEIRIGVHPINKGCGCLDFTMDHEKLRAQLKERRKGGKNG